MAGKKESDEAVRFHILDIVLAGLFMSVLDGVMVITTHYLSGT